MYVCVYACMRMCWYVCVYACAHLAVCVCLCVWLCHNVITLYTAAISCVKPRVPDKVDRIQKNDRGVRF